MESESDKLRMFFLPFITPGHMIPMVDEARVFAKHGVDVTIITTQANAALFQNQIDRDSNAGHRIKIHVLQFPSAQVGVPDGIENLANITSLEMAGGLLQGMQLLQKPIEQLIHDVRPDCIVADMFFPWSLQVATELGIPRLAFRGTSYFSLCAEHCVRIHEPHKSTDSDVVLLPGFPHKIEMLTSQLPEWSRTTTNFTRMMEVMRETEENSYGMLVNSFHELEDAYEEYFKTTMGLKAWSVGPVSLWMNWDVLDKAERYNIAGGDGPDGHNDVMEWLNSKNDNSVLYVNFGSLTKLSATQLKEIAHGLEASDHLFIWVVRKTDKGEYKEVFPEGFEKRMRESKRGLIIKRWAPQMLILDHPSIGGMVTHCGWNSILEGLSAGLPMITWPLFAEQFYNEKLLTDVVRIGVAVGSKEWKNYGQEGTALVSREKVEKAVRLVMGEDQEEAVELRKRVSELQVLAKKAIEVGGLSHANLMALINDLKSLKIQRSQNVTS
jgi:UDP:flavonoid glycosyltransferase YjiC (YdhE family)